jgi:transcriptional regulator with XRE-family HTH domain
VDHTRRRVEQADARQIQEDVTAKAVSAAVGAELRQVRETRGWSRSQFIARLPSGIGERTLLAYEHGLRQLTILRLLELCYALDVMAPMLLNQALQKACIHLANLTLQVDLRELINARSVKFRPLVQWAQNKLNNCPDGIAELTPSVVAELATFMGHEHRDLANYLARFIPETPLDDADAMVGAHGERR